MTQKLDNLQAALEAALGGRIKKFKRERGEITITVAAADWSDVAKQLRDDSRLRFEQLVDQPTVEVEALGVGLTGALRKDPRPGDREPISSGADVLH